MSKTFIEKVSSIQSALKAPKNQRNNFGNYNYRNQEDILEAVKPLLKEHGLVLTINDELVATPTRIYIKATATITDGTNSITNSALAREAETQKGMSDPQISGSTSSYARKYALNGLFLIDDTRDDDATNTHGKDKSEEKSPTPKVNSFQKKSVASEVVTKEVVTSPEEKAVEESPKKKFGGFGNKAKSVETVKETNKKAGDLY